MDYETQNSTLQHVLPDTTIPSTRSFQRGPLRPTGWEERERKNQSMRAQRKRSADAQRHNSSLNVIAAALILLMCAPVLFIIAVLIKLSSRGPVFYTQERLGLHEKPFRLYKFRSMYSDAEGRLEQILESDPKLKLEYDTFHKLRNDPRITPIGKLLRRTSLDELPQLLNVVTGDINLVGPRAYLPAEKNKMQKDTETILSRKPGITGLWQVSGRNSLSFEKRVKLESHYVRNRTRAMDLIILAKTFRTVIKGDGAQ
jgi:lipopolysaccharide/colanic/teichoic acid biosynthesis glycosyltransferase